MSRHSPQPMLDFTYKAMGSWKEIELTSVNSWMLAPSAVLLLFIGWSVIYELQSPLKDYPGPTWAKYTNLWRFFLSRTGSYHLHVKALHDKHGPVVRMGPKLLDLDIPSLVKTVYGTDGKWCKTNMYKNNSAVMNGKVVYHLFSETDQSVHARMKRPIIKYYSQSSVLRLEPLLDTVITDYCTQLETRFISTTGGPGKAFDLGRWLAYYSWDTNGATTFTHRFGYMDKAEDFDGTLDAAEKTMTYFAQISQLPWLDHLLEKNPIHPIGPPNIRSFVKLALAHMTDRAQGKDTRFDPNVPDYLHYFLEAKKTHPDIVDNDTAFGYLLVNVIAGADTTSITLKGIFNEILRDKRVWDKMEQEILESEVGMQAKEGVAGYLACRKLPYTVAVVRECMRLHPVVSMMLERYVPEAGLQLPHNQGFVPGGISVGLNPYVIHRNTQLWGNDADTFRPERFLRGGNVATEKGGEESEEEYQARMRLYDASDLTFGGGSRICIGRNIALLEVYKVLVTLIARYKIVLDDPAKELKIEGSWLPKMTGLIARFEKR